MFRAQPEVSRICTKKHNEWAYKRHLENLKHIKSTIDDGVNFKARSPARSSKKSNSFKNNTTQIKKQNIDIVNRLDRILKEDHFETQFLQRPFTLQGKFQKERMNQITKDNERLAKALQTSKPIIKRTDWVNHSIEHIYQHYKNSLYNKTLSMSEVIKIQEDELSSRRKRPQSKELNIVSPPSYPNSARPSTSPTKKRRHHKDKVKVEENEENQPTVERIHIESDPEHVFIRQNIIYTVSDESVEEKNNIIISEPQSTEETIDHLHEDNSSKIHEIIAQKSSRVFEEENPPPSSGIISNAIKEKFQIKEPPLSKDTEENYSPTKKRGGLIRHHKV